MFAVNDKKIKKNKKIKNNIVLNIGTSADFPPFEMNKNGKIVGIEIDLMNEISKETGIKFVFNDMSFKSVIASLTTNKIDLGVSGISKTEERKKSVDFTDEYINVNFALITKEKDKNKTLKDFAGKKIAVQTGTIMQDYVVNYNKNSSEKDKVNIVIMDDNSISVEALLKEKVDGFFVEELQAKVYTKMYDGLVYQEVYNKEGGYAIALTKNSKYTKIINNALNKIKKQGKIDKIIKKWEEKYIAESLKENKKQEYIKSLLYIAKGSFVSIQYSLCAILIGLFMSLIFTLMMYSGVKILFYFVRVYVSIIRGTPLLLQMSFVYFGLSHLIGINLSIFTSCVIALSINSSAYLVEIIRSGVRTIDKGQFEACKSLNIPKFLAVKDIYIPQVIHNIFPALINEFIALIKETSIVSVLGGYEIMKRTNMVIAEYYSYFIPLIVAGFSYYIITFTLEMFAHWWEKKHVY